MSRENTRLARLVKHREHFKCEMCGKTKLAKMYEYRNISFVRGFTPHHYKQLCGDCIYKKVYGSRDYKIKKKEGTLDK